MAKITVVPDNVEFIASNEENILAAGIANNLNLPHGCKNGACGACKCKIISGEVRLEQYNKIALPDDEINQGYTLLCKAHALSDIVVNIPNILNGFPIKTMPSKVLSINKINQTAILTLKLPANLTYGFYAGQYIEIMLQGKNRSYSIASNPDDDGIELHVRYHKGGVFSELVWEKLAIGQILRFRGPLGNFRLQDTQRPVIMICTGTGFAPIKAILSNMASQKIKRKIYFYWGNRTVNDFYLTEIIAAWQEQLDIKVILCLSQEVSGAYYSGYVTQALAEDFRDLSDFEVYACGNLNMIEDVYELATDKLNLNRANFYSDAFTPSV